MNRVRTNISTSKIRPEYLYVAVIAFNFACFAFKKKKNKSATLNNQVSHFELRSSFYFLFIYIHEAPE